MLITEEEKDIDDMIKLEAIHNEDIQKCIKEKQETATQIDQLGDKIKALEAPCKQKQEELAAQNKHDPLSCQYCIEAASLEIKKKTQLTLLSKTNEKIKAQTEQHERELHNRELRKENRNAEMKELRERIEELTALEAEIDEDLLELEDVKTIIHEKLHMKLYDYSKNQ